MARTVSAGGLAAIAWACALAAAPLGAEPLAQAAADAPEWIRVWAEPPAAWLREAAGAAGLDAPYRALRQAVRAAEEARFGG